jgi:hypothetical protein
MKFNFTKDQIVTFHYYAVEVPMEELEEYFYGNTDRDEESIREAADAWFADAWMELDNDHLNNVWGGDPDYGPCSPGHQTAKLVKEEFAGDKL